MGEATYQHISGLWLSTAARPYNNKTWTYNLCGYKWQIHNSSQAVQVKQLSKHLSENCFPPVPVYWTHDCLALYDSRHVLNIYAVFTLV